MAALSLAEAHASIRSAAWDGILLTFREHAEPLGASDIEAPDTADNRKADGSSKSSTTQV